MSRTVSRRRIMVGAAFAALAAAAVIPAAASRASAHTHRGVAASSAATGSPAAYRDYCRITASSATVRAEPRTSAAAVGTAYRGDTCTAYGWAGRGSGWVHVKITRTGVRGYVHSSLVSWGKESLGRTGP
ncbi:SH3 domain-containing protein [Streptomyces sp. NPDC050095]|uniref:SH3 domain-containing protein n=1 Tax=unclassified Streptomyces TaxID=2593676 RepID=UPI003426FC54